MRKFLSVFIILLLIAHEGFSQQAEIKIHYLGHSSFILSFDKDISVLTDYGQPNAFVEYGKDSPIFSLGDFMPTLITYSNSASDHCDPLRIDTSKTTIVIPYKPFSTGDLTVSSFQTSLNKKSKNTIYIFNYKGMNLVHLGECQNEILKTDSLDTIKKLKNKLPQEIDVLFMPIEGKVQFKEQAMHFIDSLNPKTVIPMHYWHENYKEEFFNYVDSLNKNDDKKLKTIKRSKSSYTYKSNRLRKQKLIIDLIPSEYLEQ